MRHVLTVFIASPSDLAEERRRAFEVVEEINLCIKELNWCIDLLGWEDTLPGYGRPQALINSDAERCDLFIGLLWRRWGTPPGNEGFTSGFEEEYATAMLKRKNGPSPEIWMFFKTIDPAQVADPGAQLQRVLEFQQDVISGQGVFFKKFSNVDEWGRLLSRYLLRHIHRLARVSSDAPEGTTDRALLLADSSGDEPPANITQGAGGQISAVSQLLKPAFADGDLSKAVAAFDNPQELTFLAARSLLLSITLVWESRSSRSPMPIHELNTLYRFRERLLTTAEEHLILFVTLMTGDSEVNPGWYWFRDLTSDEVTNRLAWVALFTDATGARCESFEILRRAQKSIFVGQPPHLVERRLGRIPSDVQESAWAYLVDTTKADDVQLLRDASGGTWIESRMDWLAAWTKANRDLDVFLSTMPDLQFIPKPMEASILEQVEQLATASLTVLSLAPNHALSNAAKTELDARNDQKDETKGMAADSSGWVRFGSLGLEPDQDRYKSLENEATESIRKSLTWANLDGPSSYRLLIERGDLARDTARSDIMGGFQRVRDEHYRRLEETLFPDVLEESMKQGALPMETMEQLKQLKRETVAALEERRGLEQFITQQFSIAGLEALSLGSTPEDAVVARHFLEDERTRKPALRILLANGCQADVSALLTVARSSFGEERKLALDAIIKLAENQLETVKALLDSDGRDISQAGLLLIPRLAADDAEMLLKELLSHHDDDVRVGAVSLLHQRLNVEQLEETLSKYLEAPSYFYNVVVWFDRLLYAPEPLSTYYREKFQERLSGD